MKIPGPDLYWLAGYLEGEGTFGLDGNGYARASVEATDYDVVARAAFLMGARPPWFRKGRRENWSDQWTAGVVGRKATELLVQIRPLMGSRRGTKIDEILATAKEVKRAHTSRKKPSLAEGDPQLRLVA